MYHLRTVKNKNKGSLQKRKVSWRDKTVFSNTSRTAFGSVYTQQTKLRLVDRNYKALEELLTI